MMKAKYEIKFTSKFKKSIKRISKQGKDVDKLMSVIEMISSGKKLDMKYKNHRLISDKYYINCFECHIEPDWLLIYKYINNNMVLLLVDTGSHSEMF